MADAVVGWSFAKREGLVDCGVLPGYSNVEAIRVVSATIPPIEAMDAILAEFEKLNSRSNLSKVVADIDRCLALLEDARNQIAERTELALSAPDLTDNHLIEPLSRGSILPWLEQGMNVQLEKVGSDHKEVYTQLNRYGKALDKVCSLELDLLNKRRA
jgi:hypothetical protein